MNAPLRAIFAFRDRGYIFNGQSQYITCWDAVVTAGVVFKLTVVPVVLVFHETRFASYAALNTLVDTLLLFDICVRFRTSFVERGFEVTSARRIALRYFRGWLAVDVIASLPFFLGETWSQAASVAAAAGSGRPAAVSPLQWGLAMARIASVRRLVGLMATLCSSRAVTRHAYLAAFLPAACLVFNFVLSAHWLGLLWYLIAIRPLEADPAYDALHDWHWLPANGSDVLYLDSPLDGSPRVELSYDVATRYVCSIYWALAVMTSLKGLPAHESRQCLWRDPLVKQPLEERTYTLVVFIFGAIFYSCIYGNVAQYIQLLYSSELRYRQRMEELDEFTRFHEISPNLQRRVRRYVQFQWAVTRGIDIDTLAGGLPKHMQLEIRLQLNQRLVEAVDIFAGCTAAFFEELVAKLVPVTALAAEPIFNEGEPGSRMFFVKRGAVQVRRGGVVIATLAEGHYFGELALLTDQPRSTDVVAHTDLILLGLSRVDFEEVLTNFPDSRLRIEFAAAGRLRDLREREDKGPITPLREVQSVGRRMSLADMPDKRRISPQAGDPACVGSRHSSAASSSTSAGKSDCVDPVPASALGPAATGAGGSSSRVPSPLVPQPAGPLVPSPHLERRGRDSNESTGSVADPNAFAGRKRSTAGLLAPPPVVGPTGPAEPCASAPAAAAVKPRCASGSSDALSGAVDHAASGERRGSGSGITMPGIATEGRRGSALLGAGSDAPNRGRRMSASRAFKTEGPPSMMVRRVSMDSQMLTSATSTAASSAAVGGVGDDNQLRESLQAELESVAERLHDEIAAAKSEMCAKVDELKALLVEQAKLHS